MDVGGRLLFIIAQKIIIQYTVASNTNCLDFFDFSNMDITSESDRDRLLTSLCKRFPLPTMVLATLEQLDRVCSYLERGYIGMVL